MGNYSLVADNVFQRRSFDDLLRPLAMYTEEYNNVENAIGELDTKASVWEGMANKESDPEAYAQYKRYADELRNQATTLAHSGLNPSTRRNILNLKRRYASEIAPIEQAYASRKAQADEQRKALLQNPTLLLSRRADVTSLDDYIRNPQLGYDSYSGSLLTQQVGTAAAAIAKELRDYGNGKRLDAYTKTWLQQHGFTAGEVAQAINNPNHPDSAKVLTTLVNNVIADSGVSQWADRATLNQAYDYAKQGLWQAVGQTDIKPYTDQGAVLRKQSQIANEAANRARRSNHPLLIPRALRSQQELGNNFKQLQNFINERYVEFKDGKYVITKKGMKAYGNKEKMPKTREVNTGMGTHYSVPTGEYYYEDSQFKKYMDHLNGDKPLYDNSNGLFMSNHAGNLFSNAVKYYDPESYDTYHTTEYIRQLDDTYSKEVKRQVMSEGEIFNSLDFNGKNGWNETKIDKSKLEDYTPTRINYSRYGTTITWIDDKNDVIRTNAPKAINERVSDTVGKAMEKASLYRQVIETGYQPQTVFDKRGRKVPLIKDGQIQYSNIPLTPEDIAGFNAAWENEMDIVNTVGAMYVSPSSTKNTEFSSYDFGMGIGPSVNSWNFNE